MQLQGDYPQIPKAVNKDMGEKRLPHVPFQGWKDGVPYKGPCPRSSSSLRALAPRRLCGPHQPLDGLNTVTGIKPDPVR